METLQRDGMVFNVVSSEKEAFEYALEQFAGEARTSLVLTGLHSNIQIL